MISKKNKVSNQPWVTIQAVNPFDNQIQNIDGTGSYGGEFRDSAILGFTSIATAGLGQTASKIQHIKSSPALYNQFAKATKGIFKLVKHINNKNIKLSL